jgi:hypothetical protein
VQTIPFVIPGTCCIPSSLSSLSFQISDVDCAVFTEFPGGSFRLYSLTRSQYRAPAGPKQAISPALAPPYTISAMHPQAPPLHASHLTLVGQLDGTGERHKYRPRYKSPSPEITSSS